MFDFRLLLFLIHEIEQSPANSISLPSGRYQELHDMREQGRPTVPSIIREEKRTNIFLRAGVRTVRSALGMDNSEPFDVFKELRRRKDVFK
jgi:hydroxyacylglutathione hydrolase